MIIGRVRVGLAAYGSQRLKGGGAGGANAESSKREEGLDHHG